MGKNKNKDKNKKIIIDNIEDFLIEYDKFKKNEKTDFSATKWDNIVKDSLFSEEHMLTFQVIAQNYYEDFIKSHKVSDDFIKKMYYDFIGHVNLNWLTEEQRNKIKS